MKVEPITALGGLQFAISQRKHTMEGYTMRQKVFRGAALAGVIGCLFCTVMTRLDNSNMKAQLQDLQNSVDTVDKMLHLINRNKRSLNQDSEILPHVNDLGTGGAHMSLLLPPEPEGLHNTHDYVSTYNGTVIGYRSVRGFYPATDGIYRIFELNTTVTPNGGDIIQYTRGEGHAYVKQAAVYHLYVHMTYFVKSVTCGYKVVINDRDFIKCVTKQKVVRGYSFRRLTQAPITCSISAAVYLPLNSTIRIKALYNRRHILPNAELSFWGLVRAG